jgi:uncharacterized membrane protein
VKVLLAGETWMSYGIHVKGFGAYYTGSYGTGATPLLDALVASNIEVTHLENHLAPTDFPNDVAQLNAYDVVILSDIGADTLLLHPDVFLHGLRRPDPLRAIGEYVASGGGLLMIGGYMSFSGFEGRARYHASSLVDVLPVRMLGHDDRVEEPVGVNPRASAQHPILAGIPSEWPYFLGYNRLIAKTSADVLMTVQDDPFLILGSHGSGRTAAFASDCSPHWGSPEFIGWEAYGRFWSQLLTWLSGQHAPNGMTPGHLEGRQAG